MAHVKRDATLPGATRQCLNERDEDLPMTNGVPMMAGTVNPTPILHASQVLKSGAKAVAMAKILSMSRYMKNAGRRPMLAI